MDRRELEKLFSKACHGAGAEERIDARRALRLEATARGHALTTDMLREQGFCLAAYFASAPLSWKEQA